MSGATDTPGQRLAEYQRLFSDALTGRERTEHGVRFAFDDRPGLADWIRDLSDREHACCPFMFFDITVGGSELWWDVSTIDDDTARIVLDGLYDLPDARVGSVDELLADYSERASTSSRPPLVSVRAPMNPTPPEARTRVISA